MTTSVIASSADAQLFCPRCFTLSPRTSGSCPECRMQFDWLANYPDFAAVLAPGIQGCRIELRVQVEWAGGKSEFTRSEPGTWELPAGPAGWLCFEYAAPPSPLLIRWPHDENKALQLPSSDASNGVTVTARLVAVSPADCAPALSLTPHDGIISLANEPAAVHVGRRAGRRIGSTRIQLNHSSVAPQHCVLVRDVGQRRYWLADAGSETGTFVNRRPILAVELSAGDLIQVGPYAWTFNQVDGLLVPVPPVQGLNIVLQQATVLKSPDYRVKRRRAGGAAQRPTPALDSFAASDEGIASRLGPLNLQIDRGAFLAVVGPSGAGKSTLIEALVGAPRTLDKGRVLADGHDIAEQRDWLRRRLGYVSQREVIRAELTARQAVRLSVQLRKGHADERRVEQLLRQVELEWGDWDRPVGELSGGQAKRVRIAAELVNEPGLLILDEPGSGLDPDREKAVVRLLRTLAYRGCTVVMVTHNWQRLVDVDRVLVLQEGKPAFDGSPEELLQKIPTRDFADLDLSRLGARQEPAMGAYFPASSGPKRQRGGFRAIARRTREMALQFWSLLRREGAILASPIGSTQAWRNPLFGLLRAAFALVRDPPARREEAGFFELGSASIPAANGLSTRSKGGLRHWLKSNRTLGPPAPRTAPSALTSGFQILRRVALPLFWAPLFFASALTLSVKSTEVEQLGFFAVLATIWMGASLSLMSIVDEREVFDHERLLFLHVVPYVAAKMTPLWILSLLQTCVFAALLAMFRGQTGWLYGGIWTVAYLVPVGLAATGMGLVISAIANRSAPTANLILPLAMIAQIVFNVHVAGDGKAELDEAYGGFHARHCQTAGCNRYASVWLPHDGWRCREHCPAPDDSDVCNRWAARASYGTIARYGDIALRSFAYKKPDAEAYLGRDPETSSVRRRRELHEEFGYSVWRKDAVRSLAAMIVCFPALAVIVLWSQSSHPFKASGSVKRVLAQSHRSDFAKLAATPDCAADQLPG